VILIAIATMIVIGNEVLNLERCIYICVRGVYWAKGTLSLYIKVAKKSIKGGLNLPNL
jgi:hypothetical protein